MLLKDLFFPSFEGMVYYGFIGAVEQIKHIEGKWLQVGEGETGISPLLIDNMIKLRCGNKEVYTAFEDKADIKTYELISDIFSSYQYELDGLYDSLFYEYNPIDNYDRTETQTNNSSTAYGSVNIKNDYDTVETTDVIGKRTQNNIIDDRSHTDVLGAEHTTTTNTNSTSAFDSADYDAKTDKNITDTSANARTNTHSEDGYSDKIENESATDKSTVKARTDETTTGAHTDTVNGGYTLRARGNIGVTTTMQMITEQRKVLLFNFVDCIIDIIHNEITNMEY